MLLLTEYNRGFSFPEYPGVPGYRMLYVILMTDKMVGSR
jgi:hypothetical protein